MNAVVNLWAQTRQPASKPRSYRGEWAAGDLMAAETMLADDFGIHRSVVRQVFVFTTRLVSFDAMIVGQVKLPTPR